MKNLTEGNIYKNFILFAVPIILAGLFSQAYVTIDSIIAGKFLGEQGLAAIGATSAFLTFISSIFWGYGTGAAVHTATLFGSKNYKMLKTSLCSNRVVFIIANLVVSGFALVFKDLIFDFLRVDESIRRDASYYYIIMISFKFVIVLNTYGTAIFNALGMSGYPFKMSVVCAVLNVAGNILSVTILKMGVVGLAISSVFSALVVDICYYVKLQKCFDEVGCRDYKVRISLDSVEKSLGYALPVTVQQGVMYLASLIISPLINGIGSAATAAYSVVLRIYDINAGIYQNSAKTVTNYVAQSIGGEKFENLKKGVKVGFLQGIVFLAPVLCLCVIFARPFCEAFFPKGYVGEALELSVVYVRCFLPFILFNVVNNFFHSFFRGVKAMNLLVFFTALGSAIRIVATMLLTDSFGMYGVYSGWVISWVGEAVLIYIAYLCGGWKKNLNIEI